MRDIIARRAGIQTPAQKGVLLLNPEDRDADARLRIQAYPDGIVVAMAQGTQRGEVGTFDLGQVHDIMRFLAERYPNYAEMLGDLARATRHDSVVR